MQLKYMTSAKKKAIAARVDKHRDNHKLVQTWVSPEFHKALVAHAKGDGRTVAGYVRHVVGKIIGVAE
jgi:hypothetical protein